MNEILSPLNEDELTILMIAMRGESMMPIGRWEDTVLGLARRGLLEMGDKFNYFITPAGREAAQGAEAEDDRAIDQALGKVLQTASASSRMREVISAQVDVMAEGLALLMSEAGRGSGESPTMLAREWGAELVRRTVAKLEGP